MSMPGEEYLGPAPGDPIMICPECGYIAWVGCRFCGWSQWTPPDDPESLRSDYEQVGYSELVARLGRMES